MPAASKKLGTTIVGFSAWDGKASSYEALAVKIKKSGAQGIFLGGLICENGGKLIKDLRNGLGPSVKILMPDGFTPISATVQQSPEPPHPHEEQVGSRRLEVARQRSLPPVHREQQFRTQTGPLHLHEIGSYRRSARPIAY